MANVRVESESLSAMAKAIRSKTGKGTQYYPGTMSNGVDEVYDKGKSDGYNAGYAEGESAGYNTGYQAQYDLFWDTIQKNGERTDYQYAFAGMYYYGDIFYPKYDIKPVGSVEGMWRKGYTWIDLVDRCEKCGITIDYSKVTKFNNFMYINSFYRIGVIDCSSCNDMTYAFNNAASLKTIDKLILHEGITTYLYAFANSALLQNITIEGTIAGDKFDISSHTNLTHDSLMSIIDALKDYSGTTTTKTITLGATNLAKLTDAEITIATEKGWSLA